MKLISNQVMIAIALGISTSLTSLPVVAETSPITPIIVAQASSSMTPEQIRQSYQKSIGQMQQMLKEMQEEMEQMTPEEITQMHKQHQQMMSEMEQLAGQIHQMGEMVGIGTGTMNHHQTQQ
ncbi:hypothetical protein [Crocosphaera sp. XPORK-15E]|uniref:hypothetical protein n=1 Tax=Crocosphaera sp. XPORK-15E TaxID=3110247 RepID=UPI002B20C892|nr:hypothetical protein [Crocosphaera sp. XPORK-15E]MEA5532998.1 hypothetical protein [Crocosphaera sp. XPORK-15E]